jgi:hypothetical protein
MQKQHMRGWIVIKNKSALKIGETEKQNVSPFIERSCRAIFAQNW